MKKNITALLILFLIGMSLSGCSSANQNDPGQDSDNLVDVSKAKIAWGTDPVYKEITDIDIIRQLSTQLSGYDSQSFLYKELSAVEYEAIVADFDLSDTYYITLIFSNGNETKFDVYKDGTVIKLKNGRRYQCQVLTDYEFFKGLYNFNESLKNHLTYDKVNVAYFFELFSTSYEGSQTDTQYKVENCYRIYSNDLLINNTYQVFKFTNDCASFLLYNGVIYELGPWFGGLGVVDVKIADIDSDGFDEVYFTNSWGTGIHWNGLSYFDTKNQNIKQLFVEKRHYQELMLTSTQSGIIVSRAYFSSSANNRLAFVDLTLTEKSELGLINYREEIVFDVFNN